MHFEHDDNGFWELGENPLGASKSKPPFPPPKEKTNWASRYCLSPCIMRLSGICVHNYVCHPFLLPTWNLPTQVKIPIYLDATLLQTLVGLGFNANWQGHSVTYLLLLYRDFVEWVTSPTSHISWCFHAFMLSCHWLACCSQGSEHKVRRIITHLMTLLPWELLHCKCDYESVFLVEFFFSHPPTKHYLAVH